MARFRFYATLKSTPDLLSLYRAKDLDGLAHLTRTLLLGVKEGERGGGGQKGDQADGDQTGGDQIGGDLTVGVQTGGAGGDQTGAAPSEQARSDLLFFINELRVVSAPSLDWRAAFASPKAAGIQAAAVVPRDITPDELIIAYEIPDERNARTFLDLVAKRVAENRDRKLAAGDNAFLGGGFDPGGSIAGHWCPGTGTQAIFGHRRQARRAVRAEALTSGDLLGQRVNVAIIDEGLDKAAIPAKNWGGGLDHYIDTDLALPAGAAPYTSHGMMVARGVLDLAPEARLYDVPVVSATQPLLPVNVSAIQAAYASLIHEILHRRHLRQAPWDGPWVLVNAWGIYDTSTDPTGSYTENKEPGGHPFINLVTRAVERHHLDIVFAAGNCGTYCPSQRCGGRDRGPGRSIWGANAHPLVITLGAVRSDETWIGYSSQGPAPKELAENKPDLCAPSQFVEEHDAALLSSGTSASVGIAAGVVAALRSKWDQSAVTPQQLKAALIDSARKPRGPAGWDHRLGYGILDAAATIAALP